MKQIENQLDHRILGEQLGIFKFSDLAPGIPFFLPRGVFLYHKLQELIRRYYDKYNYQEIFSPLFMSSDLWKCSGHYDYFKQNMFFLEEEKYALKPMNCPAHMALFDSMKVDKKELPLRIADFGKLFRNENSGSLHGLARVKSFSQDDAHIFLAPEQLEAELNQLIDMVLEIYIFFGFKDFKIFLSSRPEQKAGNDQQWDEAEGILRKVLSKVDYQENPGEGAFYGPKIDFEVADSSGRYFQLGSIQLDFQLPERFNLKYYDNNEAKQPIVVHRAILGSLERFIAILLEDCQGWLPVEFSKVQAQVVVLKDQKLPSEYLDKFQELGIRYQVFQESNLKQAIKNFYEQKLPYLFIIGAKEISNKNLMVKSKSGQEKIKLEDLGKFWKLKNRF